MSSDAPTPRELQQCTPVLVVEDSPEDFEATQRAFSKVHPDCELHHCESGEAALDFLHRRGSYACEPLVPRPAMILLDLNLPVTDGYSVIGEIQADAQLRTIPVVVLTTSTDPRDVAACYAAGASHYMSKPVDYHRFVELIAGLRPRVIGH